MTDELSDEEGLRLEGSDQRVAVPGSRDGPREVILGLRPEDLHLGEGEHPIEAVVDFADLTGPDVIVFARHGGNPLVASLPPHTHVAPDSKVRFTFSSRNMHLFDRASGRRIAP